MHFSDSHSLHPLCGRHIPVDGVDGVASKLLVSIYDIFYFTEKKTKIVVFGFMLVFVLVNQCQSF